MPRRVVTWIISALIIAYVIMNPEAAASAVTTVLSAAGKFLGSLGA